MLPPGDDCVEASKTSTWPVFLDTVVSPPYGDRVEKVGVGKRAWPRATTLKLGTETAQPLRGRRTRRDWGDHVEA